MYKIASAAKKAIAIINSLSLVLGGREGGLYFAISTL